MNKSKILRIIGGAIWFIMLWIVVRFDIKPDGPASIILLIGFPVAFEYLVIRPVVKYQNAFENAPFSSDTKTDIGSVPESHQLRTGKVQAVSPSDTFQAHEDNDSHGDRQRTLAEHSAQPVNKEAPPPAVTISLSAEEDFWAIAMNEVETGQRRPGVWAKAFVECDGDETKSKVAYLKARVQQLTDAASERESQREIWLRQQALEASALEKELPELAGRTVDGYVPIARHEWHGIKVRELKNGVFAVETSRQQRCYRGSNAAKDAVQEFVKHGRWTLKNLDFAVDRQLSANAGHL